MENPTPIDKIESISKNFQNTLPARSYKASVPTYYKKDGGAYLTAGVIIAKDPETGVQKCIYS